MGVPPTNPAQSAANATLGIFIGLLSIAIIIWFIMTEPPFDIQFRLALWKKRRAEKKAREALQDQQPKNEVTEEEKPKE